MTPAEIVAAVRELVALGVDPAAALATVREGIAASAKQADSTPEDPAERRRRLARERQARKRNPVVLSVTERDASVTDTPPGSSAIPSENTANSPTSAGSRPAPARPVSEEDPISGSENPDLPALPRVEGPGTGVTPSVTSRKAKAPPGDIDPKVLRAWLVRWKIPLIDDPVDGTEVEAFLDHHRKHGNAWADWSATWRTWTRNRARFAAERATRGPAPAAYARDHGATAPAATPGRPPPRPEALASLERFTDDEVRGFIDRTKDNPARPIAQPDPELLAKPFDPQLAAIVSGGKFCAETIRKIANGELPEGTEYRLAYMTKPKGPTS